MGRELRISEATLSTSASGTISPNSETNNVPRRFKILTVGYWLLLATVGRSGVSSGVGAVGGGSGGAEGGKQHTRVAKTPFSRLTKLLTVNVRSRSQDNVRDHKSGGEIRTRKKNENETKKKSDVPTCIGDHTRQRRQRQYTHAPSRTGKPSDVRYKNIKGKR